jgi:hypothetical protein
MSDASFVSPGTRSEAHDEKATNRPEADIDGHALFAVGSVPGRPTLARNVTPVLAEAVVDNNDPAPTVNDSAASRRTSFTWFLPITDGSRCVLSRTLATRNRRRGDPATCARIFVILHPPFYASCS